MGEPKTEPKPYGTPGPFLVSQVREGDRYELSNGHPIYCAPTASQVEVHEADKDVVTYGPGSELVAPGVLRNPVPVEALWDFAASDRVALRNLLQRFGYLDLDAVREEGREEGLRLAVLDLAELLGLEVDDARKKAIEAMSAEGLDQLRATLKRDRRFPAL